MKMEYEDQIKGILDNNMMMIRVKEEEWDK